jgi:pimeloyl-ACP methyl ester carboxylesterase
MYKPIRQLARTGRSAWKARSLPLPDAIEALRDHVQQQRCLRRRRYDLYFPPLLQPQPQPPSAILFFPGAGISQVAYAGVAARLSNAGHYVVVPSMEPFRLALPHLGADLWDIGRILRNVQRDINHTSCHWTFAGHSMGSFAAMNLWAEHYYSYYLEHNFQVSPQLVLWAMSYLPMYCCWNLTRIKDIMESNHHPPVGILIIQGQDDQFLEMTAQYKEEFQLLLPKNHCQLETIPGGTHHGFASYHPPIPYSRDFQPPTRQQELAVEETLRFLKRRDMEHNN